MTQAAFRISWIAARRGIRHSAPQMAKVDANSSSFVTKQRIIIALPCRRGIGHSAIYISVHSHGKVYANSNMKAKVYAISFSKENCYANSLFNGECTPFIHLRGSFGVVHTC